MGGLMSPRAVRSTDGLKPAIGICDPVRFAGEERAAQATDIKGCAFSSLLIRLIDRRNTS